MSRTRRRTDAWCRHPQPLEMTYRGLGDPSPFMVENPRNCHVHGFDGANRDARHPNTKRREKRVTGKHERFERNNEVKTAHPVEDQ